MGKRSPKNSDSSGKRHEVDPFAQAYISSQKSNQHFSTSQNVNQAFASAPASAQAHHGYSSMANPDPNAPKPYSVGAQKPASSTQSSQAFARPQRLADPNAPKPYSVGAQKPASSAQSSQAFARPNQAGYSKTPETGYGNRTQPGEGRERLRPQEAGPPPQKWNAKPEPKLEHVRCGTCNATNGIPPGAPSFNCYKCGKTSTKPGLKENPPPKQYQQSVPPQKATRAPQVQVVQQQPTTTVVVQQAPQVVTAPYIGNQLAYGAYGGSYPYGGYRGGRYGRRGYGYGCGPRIGFGFGCW